MSNENCPMLFERDEQFRQWGQALGREGCIYSSDEKIKQITVVSIHN
jgi:hypothetical protein